MTITQPETPPAAQALALLALPSLDQLTEDQVRGRTCVWDSTEAPLTDEAAIDLGPRSMRRLDGHYDWHPRGCRKHVSQEALLALFLHCMEHCKECGARDADGAALEGSCAVGDALLRIHMRKGQS
ncbi:hypothetical protein ABZZ80_06930 [Streptomyces sp. NPDC006356]